ncbi:hypothetical protein A2291_01680 [candidate division WOR-1 bacterium RIFOXYB2_FULL_42_35]|uniref:SIMPL domain-containing protein n=1 Tax=candidate division WOR-1 bacterium RIFOXYC2_FULL_41_25 TaxID=1802586 RepID=A0A1F4TQ70_UNCSA|nr:MAG: hypothetical protein A2247_03480 [candidate division WOR-1 bacterium RIFOXYA2_FULL_41_14]OGC25456.1 MAG: hypothetical protein A2291_01680 [candidate division WOR-1 bacterium RIFOXYB2_FULL_42_35]OGC34862.1 MAG: hypothetical protein A2462_05615 [candidate division WOR-1 bacterium RIFOXYC2_FULL_41_25]
MLKTFACLFLTLILLSPVQAIASKTDLTQIIVTGQGGVQATADLVYITLGVNQTEGSAKQAQETAAKKMYKILEKLDLIGISKKQIETTRVNLAPQYKYEGGQSTLTGYSAENLVKITIDNLDQVGNIIDSAIAAGANKVNNITFTLKDSSAHENMALDMAFKEAKAKAESLAAVAGLTLVKISSIQEAGATVRDDARAFMASKESSGSTPVVPGKIDVVGNVTVIYECK